MSQSTPSEHVDTSGLEHLQRLEAMFEDEGDTWDLSDNDRFALKWAVDSIKGLVGQNGSLMIENGDLRYALTHVLKQPFKGSWDAQAVFIQMALAKAGSLPEGQEVGK